MIDLVKILAKYNWDRVSLCKALDIHPNNFSRLKDIDNQKFSTIEKIHKITNIPYNVLLDRKVFTPNNIDSNDNIQAISILDNENEYNRLLDRLKKDLNK